jgi:hypothetical protein
VKIESTSEAIELLNSLSLNDSDYCFRGQADSEWSLQPSIYRFKDFLRYQTVIHENFLLQNKSQKPIPPLSHTNYDLEWLILCQHYGIPTRLLDWSSDFMIALFFSCYNKSKIDEDGAIFICDKMNYKNLTHYNQFHQTTKEESELAFIKTNIPNPRMRSQSGCFMIWDSWPLEKESSSESYDLWQYHNKGENDFFLKKIIIAKSAKSKILLELKEYYSITYESLFHISSPIVKVYSPEFERLKNDIFILTLWFTDAEKLSKKENIRAHVLTGGVSKNSFKGCLNLGSIILGRKPK